MANRFKTPIRVKVEVRGLDDLVRRLKDLDRKAARKAMRAGVAEVTRLVTREAKSLVPVRTGLLKKAIGGRVKTAKGGTHVYGVVKPRGGVMVRATPANLAKAAAGGKVVASRNGKKVLRRFRVNVAGVGVVDPVKYAHLVEFGRVATRPKKKKVMKGGGVVYGTHARAVPPRPFMRPAWDKYRGVAGDVIKGHLDRAIAAFWAKSRKPLGR